MPQWQEKNRDIRDIITSEIFSTGVHETDEKHGCADRQNRRYYSGHDVRRAR